MINGSNTDKLMKKINYKFKNEEYLKEALTHRSYANENSAFKNFDNEKLEFLGDAVLNLIANILILRCIICGMGLTIFFVGSIYTYCYLNRKDGQKPEDVYCDVARAIFVPTVFMLLAGVFILFQTLEVLWVWAILLSMSFCMGSIFATIKKGNRFIMILFITFMYAVILTILVSQHTLGKFFSLVSLLGFKPMW